MYENPNYRQMIYFDIPFVFRTACVVKNSNISGKRDILMKFMSFIAFFEALFLFPLCCDHAHI